MILPLSEQTLAQAVALLKAGQLVAFPTETVYGLGADASNPEAVGQIFKAKGRPADHPVIVHIAPEADVSVWAADVPPMAQALMARFWPGPLTLILRRAAGVPDAVTGGQDTVGVRAPDQPVALALLRAFGKGIAAPSANRFGRVSPTTARHVADEFGNAIPLILDGGACAVGIESTILDLSGSHPRLLRPGSVSARAIAQVIGTMPAARDADAPRASGTLEAHYQPNALVQTAPRNGLAERLQSLLAAGQRVAVWSGTPPGITATERWWWEAAPTDPEEYARALYATLRRWDDGRWDVLLLEAVPQSEEWAGVQDRLSRATFRAR